MSGWDVNAVCNLEITDDSDLPRIAQGLDITELAIHFNSSGYNTGDEFDDDRTFRKVEARSGHKYVGLTDKQQRSIFDQFLDQIYDTDLPEEGVPEPPMPSND